MISSKQELKEFLDADKRSLGIAKNRPGIFRDEIWRFERLLRKYEYALNCCNNRLYGKLRLAVLKFRFHRMSVRLGYSIPPNVFGKGLSLAHYGSVVINHSAKIGEYCRIQENVTIGATGGAAEAPVVGNRVYIGSGARIIGNITIADNVVIGAGSVVVKSITESGVTVAGVPAKVISRNGSEKYMQFKE